MYTVRQDGAVRRRLGELEKQKDVLTTDGNGEGYHGRLPVNHDRQTLPTPAMCTLALRRQTCHGQEVRRRTKKPRNTSLATHGISDFDFAEIDMQVPVGHAGDRVQFSERLRTDVSISLAGDYERHPRVAHLAPLPGRIEATVVVGQDAANDQLPLPAGPRAR